MYKQTDIARQRNKHTIHIHLQTHTLANAATDSNYIHRRIQMNSWKHRHCKHPQTFIHWIPLKLLKVSPLTRNLCPHSFFTPPGHHTLWTHPWRSQLGIVWLVFLFLMELTLPRPKFTKLFVLHPDGVQAFAQTTFHLPYNRADTRTYTWHTS